MELLEEAKRRYPVGTRFTPAHINQPDIVYTVTGDWDEYSKGKGIDVKVIEARAYVANIYYRGKWADIIQEESQVINNYNIF